MIHYRIARVVLAAALSLAGLYGQSDLATMTGIVTDPAGAAAPGVTVNIRNVDTNITRTMQTNQEGYFTITNLPPGNYELVAENSVAFSNSAIRLPTRCTGVSRGKCESSQ